MRLKPVNVEVFVVVVDFVDVVVDIMDVVVVVDVLGEVAVDPVAILVRA